METTWIILAVIALHAAAGSVAWLIVRDLVRSDNDLPRGGGDTWRWQRRPPAGDRPHGDRPAGAPSAKRRPVESQQTARDLDY